MPEAEALAGRALEGGTPAQAYLRALREDVPAVVAAARTVGGDDIAAAVAVGFEIERRLADALAPVIGPWLREGTAGLVGAPAAAARARGLEAPALAQALSIAATQCFGVADEPPERCRRLAGARAAELAVEAVELASLGFTGPPAALEGRRGVFALLTGEAAPPGELLDGLAQPVAP